MDSPVRKRALMETPDSGDDAPAGKHWRAHDFVAEASKDELTGSWLVDDIGKIDEDAVTDTWTVDCLGGGGTLQKQDEIEATEKALDSLQWSRTRNLTMRSTSNS